MGRATYTDADKAKVYVVLTTNEGNVKRTARETGVPEATVRRWKQEFAEKGPPPLEEVEAAAGDFVEQAEKTRWKALLVLDKKIDQAKPGELVNVIGMLTDKLDRAKGLALGRVEHQHHLPSPDEVSAVLGAVFERALNAARDRDVEIIDAEVVEQAPAALPPGRPTKE